MYVRLIVKVPEKLTREQKRILEEWKNSKISLTSLILHSFQANLHYCAEFTKAQFLL